jgi:hypothetical protein
MSKRVYPFAAVAVLVIAGGAAAQGPILDMVANKVIGKYQHATCEQLWEQKGQPKSEEEQRAVQFLRSDPQARIAFIDKVAGPIVNKLFECGMIP